MRQLIRAAAVALVLALSLASCDVLFMGNFPSDLTQATARIDLSGSIPASAAGNFTLSVIKLGKIEYVLLFSSLNFNVSLPHLLVLSPDLQVQNSYTLDTIDNAVPPSGTPFGGNAALAHLSDATIVIGNLQTTPSGNGLALTAKLSGAVSLPLSGWTIEGPQPGYLTWSSFGLYSSQQLFYQEYADDWSTQTSKSALVSSGGTQYNFDGVFTDPEDSLNNVALMVFAESNTSQGAFHFIQVPKSPDFSNLFSGLPIMENPAYTGTQFVKNDLEYGILYTTSDSIIGYNSHAQSFVRFAPPPADPSVETPLRAPYNSGDVKIAFSFSGGYYCTWDPATRILTRYQDWW